MEIWKTIPRTDGHYQISSKKRVKSIPRKVKSNGLGGYRMTPEKILKPFGVKGRPRIQLGRKGRKVYVDDLYALLFESDYV